MELIAVLTARTPQYFESLPGGSTMCCSKEVVGSGRTCDVDKAQCAVNLS